MKFTQKSREHIDACRFCWMCHHVCPIGNATGLERNTARARALGLSMVARDAVEYSDDIIGNVYECSLCGGCMTDCVTGWDPVMFTKEARLGAALDGKLPDYIMKLIENLMETGSIYGAKAVDIPTLQDSDTLLFLGEDARAFGGFDKAIELLNKAKVNFTVLKDEPSSGYTMDFLTGASNEARATMEACAEKLSSFKKVICYDPADARVMKREYKEYGISLAPEVVTYTDFVAGLIKDGALKPSKSALVFTPQDSPLLARDLEETSPVRDILSSCGEVREMLLNGKYTMLAGNLIMSTYMPEVIKKVALNRWVNAKNANAEILVVTSTAEYIALSSVEHDGIELMKLEEAVIKCL